MHPAELCTLADAVEPKVYGHVRATCETCGASRLFVGHATTDPYAAITASGRPFGARCDGRKVTSYRLED